MTPRATAVHAKVERLLLTLSPEDRALVVTEMFRFYCRNRRPRCSRPRPSRPPIPESVRDAVIERDRVCQHCGRTHDLQMDHIIAWSRGGSDDLENLQALCGPCNRRKGARLPTVAE